MRLKDKVALITGAGSGIGRQTALLFSKEGAAVVCVDVNENAARDTASSIKDSIAVKADVSKAADCQQMVMAAERQFGKLHVLFNNAGIMHAKDDDAITTSEEVWDLTLDINAKGVFLGCKYGIPAIRRAGGGSIINTASLVALMGPATVNLPDNYTKAVVELFMKKFPNVKVTYYPFPNSAQMLGALRAQKGSPQLDVALMDVSIAKIGTDEDLFAPLDPKGTRVEPA